jgi:hypothetical protein
VLKKNNREHKTYFTLSINPKHLFQPARLHLPTFVSVLRVRRYFKSV